MEDAVLGANRRDKHYMHAKLGRDVHIDQFYDLRRIEAGDSCPHCGHPVQFAKGIEVGHVFKLGTKYSEAMGATFLDENGKEQPMIMGCYGIGVTRLLAAVIEQHHDQNGIIWPRSVAPFDLHLITVNTKDKEQQTAADTLYDALKQAGYDVLYDDRPERAGVKFADADLIGIPLRIIVGNKVKDGMIEVKWRKSGETELISASELVDLLPGLVEKRN